MYGQAAAGPMRVSASLSGYRDSEPVGFAPGTEDVVLTLAGGASVEGSLVLGDIPTWALEVSVEQSLADGTGTEISRKPETGGSFEFRDLAPGWATFEVRGLFPGEPLVRIEDIPLRAGETTRDPRLQNLDLSAT